MNHVNSIRPVTDSKTTKLFFLFWCMTISYLTYGKDSYLFILFWKYLPGFSSLRVWGRLNIILIPIISWCLSLAYRSFESLIASDENGKKSWISSPLSIVTVAYLPVLGIQYYFYHNKIFDPYWTNYFKNLASYDIRFIQSGLLTFFVLFTTLAAFRYLRLKSNVSLSIALICLIFIACFEMHGVGAHMWTYKGKMLGKRMNIDLGKILTDSFKYPRIFQRVGTIALTPQYHVNIIPNWYFERYGNFLKKTEEEKQYRDILLGVNGGRRIFISDSINHDTILSFLQDAARYENIGRMISYTGDELIWEVEMQKEGYFSFIDNWDAGWKVFVNEEPEKIELLFETFKSVKLDQGFHQIRFIYQP